MLLTYGLPGKGMNNTYRLHAIAYDRENNSAELGVKTIICENGRVVKPFGAIDTPAQGGAASGSDFINWGWVLTPQPNHIATDGSTIQVNVDGVNLGNPSYNVYRQDIADLFPGYANSGGAVGYFHVDTTQYENGVHTIAWTAVDNAGNADGIGSRYFIIQNSGTGAARRGAAAFSPWAPASARRASEPDRCGRGPVGVIKGYKENTAPQMIYPGENGIITIEIKELERVVVFLDVSSFYDGYSKVGDELRPLPVGSTLDKGRGIFYWQPGPGFRGAYEFVFLNTGDRDKERIGIKVRIISK